MSGGQLALLKWEKHINSARHKKIQDILATRDKNGNGGK